MLKDDYIMRMIEQFGDILRKILTYTNEGDFKRGHNEVDAALKKIGVSRLLVQTMPTDELTRLVCRGTAEDVSKCLLLSKLIAADAQISQSEGNIETAHDLFTTSLNVLYHAHEDADEDEDKEISKDIESVKFSINENIKLDNRDPQ